MHSHYKSNAQDDSLAQLVEHNTFNVGVLGSSPRRITEGMFGTIRLQKGKYAVYTLKGSYAGLQELYNTINIDFNYTKRHGMAFEEYVSYSEEDDDTQVTKIYIPIK